MTKIGNCLLLIEEDGRAAAEDAAVAEDAALVRMRKKNVDEEKNSWFSGCMVVAAAAAAAWHCHFVRFQQQQQVLEATVFQLIPLLLHAKQAYLPDRRLTGWLLLLLLLLLQGGILFVCRDWSDKESFFVEPTIIFCKCPKTYV
jgi:hypothetical protein